MKPECSHKKSFKTRCIECELILAREGLSHAKENLNLYGKLVVKLEAELAASLMAGITR